MGLYLESDFRIDTASDEGYISWAPLTPPATACSVPARRQGQGGPDGRLFDSPEDNQRPHGQLLARTCTTLPVQLQFRQSDQDHGNGGYMHPRGRLRGTEGRQKHASPRVPCGELQPREFLGEATNFLQLEVNLTCVEVQHGRLRGRGPVMSQGCLI